MRKTLLIAVTVIGVIGLGPGQSAAQTPGRVLQLSFEAGGRVNLRAQNVTVRDILAEWARQCGCYLVNLEKLQGVPIAVPLLWEQAPQSTVLGSLLRQAAGYVLTPRRAASTGPSDYETIYILATSTPAASPYPVSVPTPMAAPISTIGSPDNEIPPVSPPEASGQPAANVRPPGQPAQSPYPGSGLPTPSVFVPIVPISSPFNSPAPARGGGSGPGVPGSAPGQIPAVLPPGTP